MPTIKIIDSIKIDIYSREHLPAHFHAIYSEHEELIEIGSLRTIVGKLPSTQRKKVVKWAKQSSKFLLENFKRLNPRL